ncbi:MAG: PQQ-dependent sugar dehydrogenase, partial [Pirellulales bacterium]|nr:PQQ-dependent sugar dehydrogenase [Pirellulales bacterium]
SEEEPLDLYLGAAGDGSDRSLWDLGSGMAPFSRVLSKEQAESLVDYILESQDEPPNAAEAVPETIRTEDYLVKTETLIEDGFRSSPWGIEFVDDRRALITERRGGLRWMVDGKLNPAPIGGLPTPTQYSDSGMYDIALDPAYEENGWVYLGYVHALGDPSSRDTPAMTRVIRGRVKDHQWVDQETIFRVADELHFARGSRWGCRLLFDTDGNLYFTIGDIGRNDEVQQPSKPGGKVYRIRPDGSIPADNPFVGKPGALEAIFTIGNRNVQGIDQHPETGAIWATEHGPMGGDEVNILELGGNYGWPVITYGLNYDGTIVSDLTHKDGMEQPTKYWTPSPGISALEFYTGDLFPKWKNDIFVGAMRFEEIKRLELDNDQVVREEVFLKGYGRVRDIKTGPDGAIYVLLNNPHKVVRLSR